jgi:hypothetical protein
VNWRQLFKCSRAQQQRPWSSRWNGHSSSVKPPPPCGTRLFFLMVTSSTVGLNVIFRIQTTHVPNYLYLYVAPSSSAFDELWFYSCTEAHETMALYLRVSV